ncbi:hypothetical protein TcasGA2_TC009969 [Tribolium castaneum]|uniref:Uncharacterized protein n=1 Tax=Tribolium castaneum TaxID=7070 RepID=D6WQQ9_TRICA|nr:hypothetical protein TcasGA2_TC009969 [Tribolium castaneum]
MGPSNNMKAIWLIIALVTSIAFGLSLHKPRASLSNVRNFDEQIRMAYQPEAEEPLRPGRFLEDDTSDDGYDFHF